MGRTPGSESSARKLENSTSVIKGIAPPAQKNFCLTAQEFHDERGLSLVGVNPRNLHGKQDISDRNWSDVFTCVKPAIGSNKKVKAYHVKPEFAEVLVHRHWDIYQEGIVFYELTQAFAKGFALEHCFATKDATNKDEYTVAWAPFAERVMKSSEEHHNLDNKRKKWEEMMISGGASIRVKTDAAGRHQDALRSRQLFDPLHLLEVEYMITGSQARVIVAKKAVEDVVLAVEDATRSLHRAEGRCGNPLVALLKDELATLNEESDRQRMLTWLQELQKQDSAEELNKLAEDVTRAKSSLALCQIELEKESAHSQFCVGLKREVVLKGHNSFMAIPPKVPKGTISALCIGDSCACAGCGAAFDTAALDIFSLPCLHVYHMLCFAHMCLNNGMCVVDECKEPLPERVMYMLGLSSTIMAKKENDCGKAPLEYGVGLPCQTPKSASTTVVRAEQLSEDDLEKSTSVQEVEDCLAHVMHATSEVQSSVLGDSPMTPMDEGKRQGSLSAPKKRAISKKGGDGSIVAIGASPRKTRKQSTSPEKTPTRSKLSIRRQRIEELGTDVQLAETLAEIKESMDQMATSPSPKKATPKSKRTRLSANKPPFSSGHMTRSSVRSASSLFDLGQGSDSRTKQSVQKENVGRPVVKKAVGESERKSDQHAGNEAGTYNLSCLETATMVDKADGMSSMVQDVTGINSTLQQGVVLEGNLNDNEPKADTHCTTDQHAEGFSRPIESENEDALGPHAGFWLAGLQSESSCQHAEVPGLQSKGLSQADSDAPTILAEQLHAVSTHTEEKDGLHEVSMDCVKEGEVVADSPAGACDKRHDVCQAHADAPTVDQEDETHSQDVVVMPKIIMAMPIVEKTCCLVLDVNGVLLTRNRLFKGGRGKQYVPKAGFEDRYLLIEPQGFNWHPFVQYVVRKDALQFLQSCLHQFHVVIWSSMMENNMYAAMEACFPSLPAGDFLSVMSQRNCKTAEFTFSDLPSASIGGDTKTHIFLKCLADIWSSFPFLNADNTLLIDDTLYKSMLNPQDCCVCPESFDPDDYGQNPLFLSEVLFPWLTRWRIADARRRYTRDHMLTNPRDGLSSTVLKHHAMLQSKKDSGQIAC